MRKRGSLLPLGRHAHEVLVTVSYFVVRRRAFCENYRSYFITRRLDYSEHGLWRNNEAPSANLIIMWVKCFEDFGSNFKPQVQGRPRASRTEDNIERAMQSGTRRSMIIVYSQKIICLPLIATKFIPAEINLLLVFNLTNNN